jgi:ribosomal protein L25 (general stress protein Ctc)
MIKLYISILIEKNKQAKCIKRYGKISTVYIKIDGEKEAILSKDVEFDI